MGKKKITRVVCLILSLLMIVSSAVIAVSANSGMRAVNGSGNYGSAVKTGSYDDYAERYGFGKTGTETDAVKPAAGTVRLDTTTGWIFVGNKGETVRIKDGEWTLTEKDGTVYHSVDEAVNAGYAREDLVRVETYDGKNALYTPSIGSVTWTFDLKAALASAGIAEEALYNIAFSYYPVVGKTASIERAFYINSEIPFNEMHSLTLPKRWASYQADGESVLSATVTPDKKAEKTAGSKAAAVQALLDEAVKAGLNAAATEDGTAVIVRQPSVITDSINAFLEKYSVRFFITDVMKNELRPTMVQAPEWMTHTLRDSDGYYANSLGFVLSPDEDGLIAFTLEGVNESMALSEIILMPYEEYNTYEEYLNNLKAILGQDLPEGNSVVKLEGEYTTHSSTNVVYPVEDRSDALTSPVDSKRTVLNTIGTEKWETAGQWIQYRFKLDNAGMYDLISRFKQSYLDGMYVNRMLKIYTVDANGKQYESADAYKAVYGNTAGYYNGVPFEEAARLRYNYNGNWQVAGLNDGTKEPIPGNTKGKTQIKTYQIYFEKDVEYILHLEVVLGSMSETIRKIESILNSLNTDYLSIIKLTGSTPDDYRDYGFTRLIPETMLDLLEQNKQLTQVSTTLKESVGEASSYTGICDKLAALVDRMGRDEDQVAKNLSNLKTYVGSLGTFLTDAKTQPLQLDYIMIQGASAKQPKAKANFFRGFAHEFSNFIWSFFRDYNSMGSMENASAVAERESVNVWLAYGRDQSQVIRNLCTNEFTPDSKISVDLKLVTGGTLLPSILAGMGPDAYLGLGQADVINYAIRGALMNVEGLEGFDEIKGNFNDAAMVVLTMKDADDVDHCYGLPENQNFPMMFIRTDILENLGIEEKSLETWEGVYVAQSTLESNNMEIGVTTDYQIFLYQMGGELFADGGMRINLDSMVGLNAFETMCNMFTQYSFPYKYEAANRFRTGEMPIIVSSYTALYNQLKVFATELDGVWKFVPLPGYRQEDGSINNLSISTVTAAVMIKKDGNDYKNAWEFVKWYTDAPCQAEYANEMVAIIGDSAKHSTANETALRSMPWTPAELEQVLRQFDQLATVSNYPGYYIIARYTEFAFLSAYNDDADPTTELLSYINTINKEITRKREEFKLETLEIGQTLAKKRAGQAMEAISLLQERYGGAKYESAILAANYAIANERINQLQESSETFLNLVKADWDGAYIEYTKVDGSKESIPSYEVKVSKQTAETKNGGYRIDSLNEQQLVYFLSVCLRDMANALASY